LGLCASQDFNSPRKRIGVEDATGQIVDVRERLARRRLKTAHYSPWRLLLLDAQESLAVASGFE
jgi:hypothetical protein